MQRKELDSFSRWADLFFFFFGGGDTGGVEEKSVVLSAAHQLNRSIQWRVLADKLAFFIYVLF